MDGNAVAVPVECPDCGGVVISACPACGATIRSLMALTCSSCGGELRPPTLFGVDIRRKPERHAALDGLGIPRDNESTAS